MKLYLIVNLSLALSHLLFLAVEKIFPSKMSFRTQLRWGQILFLLSILIPVLVQWTPVPKKELVDVSFLMPLADIGDAVKEVPIFRQVSAMTVSTSTASHSIRFSQIAFFAFILGIFLCLAYKFISLFRVQRLLNDSVLVKKTGKVRIVSSASISVPLSALFGFTAWIVVPEVLFSHFTNYKIAVKHEIQHHRQRDTVWALLIELVTPFFFLNPFIYSWKRKISEVQEFSCDEALIGRKISSYEYGSCLVRVAETALGNCRALAGTAGMAAGSENPLYFKSFLRRRIEMLVEHSTKRPYRWLAATVGTLSVIFTVTIALGAEQLLDTKEIGAINPGEAIVDLEIQKIADTALEGALKRSNASLGFVVVSDPSTGRLLAVANKDLMEFKGRRTKHWALSLKVPPASISKALVAAAAIEKGVTTEEELHNCENSHYSYGGKVFKDWKAFAQLSTADTVVHSSNVCGIKIAQKLGAKNLGAAFKAFGFGPGGTAEDFPEARSGDVPPKPGSNDALYIASYSTGNNGVYVSPIEMVQAFGAIANGGNLLKPQSASTSPKPEVIRRVLSERTARKMREILAGVLTYGTAKNSPSQFYHLAGKTATGYSHTHPSHDLLGGDSNMASFVGFGPVEDPRVVVYVAIENPRDEYGVQGSRHAAPVFRDVAEKVLQHLGVPTQSSP